MRTITETRTVYTLAELQELDSSAFDKACEDLRQSCSYDFADRVNDNSDYFEQSFLERFGIELEWKSMAYNVGYGCEFAGCKWHIVDMPKFIGAMVSEYAGFALSPQILKPARFLAFLEYGFEGIDWHEHREGDLLIDSIRWDWRTRDNETVIHILAEWFESVHAYVCDEILTSIRADYEYENSEECLLESADCNEWEFDAEGNMI